MGVRSYEEQLEASSRLSVRTKELGSRWTDFRIFSVRWITKIRVSLKSDENSWHFTWIHTNISDTLGY